jgi:transcriptional adapter 3
VRNSPAHSSSSEDSHQPPPAASIPQYQTFGSNPLEFDDPTIYHVRDVTDDMTDEEKKEIYCVSTFPHDDLRTLMAGTPPDKDFSNAKPTNQVNANTFATYIEPFFRQLTDEDMAFLKERVCVT